MADPTYTEIWDILRDASWMLYQDYLNLVSTTKTERYLDHEDDLKTTAEKLDAPFLNVVAAGLSAYRSARVSSLLGSRGVLDGALQQMARVIDVPETSPDAILIRLDEYMRDQSPIDTVLEIGGSFGSPSATAGNNGNGPMIRVTVDRDGKPLDAARFTETVKFTCEVDQHVGAFRGQEIFSIRGDAAGPDIIEIDGSGFQGQIEADSADTSLIQNSSFGDLDGDSAGSLDSIPNWEITTGSSGNFSLSQTLYRTASIESTGYSLSFDHGTSSRIRQGLRSAGATVTDPIDEPWTVSVFYNNQSGAGGTLTLELGSVSEAIAVSSGASGWTHGYVGEGVAHENLYYQNWNEEDAHIAIKWSGPASFLVDDVYVGPLRRLGATGRSTFGAIFAGQSGNNWLRDDEFTIGDTRNSAGAQGVLQWAFDTFYGRTLPNTGSSPSITEPS